MSKNKMELVLGILLIIMPFLGIPLLWKDVIYILAGMLLVLFSVMAHIKRRSQILSHTDVSQEREQLS